MSLMRGARTCRAFASAFAVKPATGRTAFLKLIHSSASVIVNDFDVLESRRCPAEADAPKTEQAQNLRWSREWSHFPDPPWGDRSTSDRSYSPSSELPGTSSTLKGDMRHASLRVTRVRLRPRIDVWWHYWSC